MKSSASRSIYLGDAIVADIKDRADACDRSWSQEMVWLLRVGLRVQHMVAATPDDTKDDSRGRHYYYPPEDIDTGVEDLRRALILKSSSRWTYSAVCRALVTVGMRFDDMGRNYLDKILSTSTTATKEPPCPTAPPSASSTSAPSPTTTAIAPS